MGIAKVQTLWNQVAITGRPKAESRRERVFDVFSTWCTKSFKDVDSYVVPSWDGDSKLKNIGELPRTLEMFDILHLTSLCRFADHYDCETRRGQNACEQAPHICNSASIWHETICSTGHESKVNLHIFERKR